MALSMASNAHLNLTACRQAARSSLTDGAALADCVFPASFSDRRSDEATVGRWLELGKKNLDFHALPTSARIEQPFVEQWHLVTQNILFRHLRELWADDRPRVMVDIGCHAVCRVHMCYACASNVPRRVCTPPRTFASHVHRTGPFASQESKRRHTLARSFSTPTRNCAGGGHGRGLRARPAASVGCSLM